EGQRRGAGAGANLTGVGISLVQLPMAVGKLLPREPTQSQRHGRFALLAPAVAFERGTTATAVASRSRRQSSRDVHLRRLLHDDLGGIVELLVSYRVGIARDSHNGFDLHGV